MVLDGTGTVMGFREETVKVVRLPKHPLLLLEPVDLQTEELSLQPQVTTFVQQACQQLQPITVLDGLGLVAGKMVGLTAPVLQMKIVGNKINNV